jgi:hypothetical protein
MNFPELAPRSKILAALAGLMLENKDTHYFSGNDITRWIEGRIPAFSAGKKRVLSSKLKEMRENNTVTILDQTGKSLGGVKVLACTEIRPYLYRIGPDTVETPMSATLLKKLYDGLGFGTTTVPAETELQVVGDTYKQFKNESDYALASVEDIKNKINDAIKALYFTRTEDGLLEPTRRLLIDDLQFIEFLSGPFPPPEITV